MEPRSSADTIADALATPVGVRAEHEVRPVFDASSSESLARMWTDARIRMLRQALGLTQESFAAELGVNVTTVVRWERGLSRPTRLALRQLEEVSQTHAFAGRV